MVIETVKVLSNEQIAQGIWQMSMQAPKTSAAYIGPGQFVNLLADDNWEHLVRRPMSIASVTDDKVDIIYKIFGETTDIFSKKKPGETMNTLGPLGNVFTHYNNSNTEPILIGGGVGLAPILNLYNLCSDKSLILGARTAAEHFMQHDPENFIYLTTDDGTLGIAGNVLAALEIMDFNTKNIIYACGPEPMLKAVQTIALENNIRTQLAVESYMGCGVGLCQGCIIERQNGKLKDHSYHEKYSLVCLDGPVYESSEVIFG